MSKQKITMTIDEKTFSAFKRLCNSRAMKVSSKVELMMQEFIENELSRADAVMPAVALAENNDNKTETKKKEKNPRQEHEKENNKGKNNNKNNDNTDDESDVR